MNRQFLKDNWPMLILMGITAIGITVTGILFHQSFLRILPLYISLTIALLQSRVIRYAPLIGGINSVLYCMVFLYYHLYGSAAYALLVSCPVQIATFIRWSRHKWGSTTIFRRMNRKQRWLTVLGFGGALLLLWLVLSLTDARYVLLDSTITMLGILISFLTMFAYIEYTGLMLVSGTVSIILYLTMIQDTPEQITYLVYTLYSFVCSCLAFVRVRKMYVKQQDEEKTMNGKQICEE